MGVRAVPPNDITPGDFFERWVPDAVASDPARLKRVAGLSATIQFELAGDDGGPYYVRIDQGCIWGARGRVDTPDLRLELEVATWRRLNAGELNAPLAAARGLLRFEGSLYLALKLHFILA